MFSTFFKHRQIFHDYIHLLNASRKHQHRFLGKIVLYELFSVVGTIGISALLYYSNLLSYSSCTSIVGSYCMFTFIFSSFYFSVVEPGFNQINNFESSLGKKGRWYVKFMNKTKYNLFFKHKIQMMENLKEEDLVEFLHDLNNSIHSQHVAPHHSQLLQSYLYEIKNAWLENNKQLVIEKLIDSFLIVQEYYANKTKSMNDFDKKYDLAPAKELPQEIEIGSTLNTQN